jgi:hypothetical protein
MKKLLDESGYVLVLRKPYLVVGGKNTATNNGFAPQIEGLSAPQAARCSVPHCCFVCAWCGEPILLPDDRIGAPFGNPYARKIDVRSVATVCHACRHIGNYSMFRACRGFDTRHMIVHAPKNGRTALLHWLQCEESTCAARVPLFVRFDEDEGAEESDAAAWLWDELTCALGHPIKKIPLDPTIELPLRTFAELK